MDFGEAASRIRRIQALTDALSWLKEYGDGISNDDGNKGSFALQIRLHNASACYGASAANDLLTNVARSQIKDTIEYAVADAENTIALDKEWLRKEFA